MGKGQGLKAPTYLGATNAALKGRSSTVVHKACSSIVFEKGALPRFSRRQPSTVIGKASSLERARSEWDNWAGPKGPYVFGR